MPGTTFKKNIRKGSVLLLMLSLLSLLSLLLLLLPAKPAFADEHYGEDAYGYLRVLYENYGHRVNNKEVVPNQDAKLAAGEWIDSMMTGFGYSARIVTNEADMSREKGNFVKDYCYYKIGTGHTGKRIVIGAHYDSVDTSGTEDNGTGVSVLLEIAKRMKDLEAYLDLEFCFWDGEEYLGYAGSFHYVSEALRNNTLKDVVLYVNLDCVGSGDNIFVYGGAYEDNVLKRSFGYNMAQQFAKEMGISLHSLPPGLPNHHTPASTAGSDQFFFNDQGVPYVYFACTAMYDENGNVFYPERPSKFHTADPRVTETENGIRGQVIHTVFDDLNTLEALFPGRIQQHFSELIPLVIRILRETNLSSSTVYADKAPVYLNPPEEETSEEETEEETTEEETSEEETAEETGEEETEGAGNTEETAEGETPEETPEEKPEQETEAPSEEAEETLSSGSEKAEEEDLSLPERIAFFLVIGLLFVWITGLLVFVMRRRKSVHKR